MVNNLDNNISDSNSSHIGEHDSKFKHKSTAKIKMKGLTRKDITANENKCN